MADTIQVVLWALGQSCPLRQGADWEKPATAMKALSDLQTYSRLRKLKGRGFGVMDDVCVCSVTGARAAGHASRYDYPSGGFLLSSRSSGAGGLPSLHRLCGDCPANGDAGGVAGCAGSFHQALYSDELQEQLERLSDRLALASKLDAYFPATRRHGFRFWINSPIPFEAAAVLHQLLEAVQEEDARQGENAEGVKSTGLADLNAFLVALERSVAEKIPLHVSLTPPGHTDLGWYTIFPHCPRCKAAAPVKRWKRKYSDEPIACAVCGESFSPAKTQSSVRDEWKLTELRDTLGQAEFLKFAVRHLMAQGAPEPEAVEIVRETEEWERLRREKWALNAGVWRRHDRFVEANIYKGLTNLAPPEDAGRGWLFSLEDVEEILRRSERHGGKVLSISHFSASGETDAFVRVTWLNSAAKVLRKLRDQGCREKFLVYVKFPAQVVEAWEREEAK